MHVMAERAILRRRKSLVTISVVANLTLLGIFKYAGFFTQSLADLLALFGFELSAFTRSVVLPVGLMISCLSRRIAMTSTPMWVPRPS